MVKIWVGGNKFWKIILAGYIFNYEHHKKLPIRMKKTILFPIFIPMKSFTTIVVTRTHNLLVTKGPPFQLNYSSSYNHTTTSLKVNNYWTGKARKQQNLFLRNQKMNKHFKHKSRTYEHADSSLWLIYSWLKWLKPSTYWLEGVSSQLNWTKLHFIVLSCNNLLSRKIIKNWIGQARKQHNLFEWNQKMKIRAFKRRRVECMNIRNTSVHNKVHLYTERIYMKRALYKLKWRAKHSWLLDVRLTSDLYVQKLSHCSTWNPKQNELPLHHNVSWHCNETSIWREHDTDPCIMPSFSWPEAESACLSTTLQ